MGPKTRVLAKISALIGAFLWPQGAMADCSTSVNTTTCSGDISGGVEFLNTATETLIVEDLTADIQPAGEASAAFVGFAESALTIPLEVSFDGGNFLVSTNGDGVVVEFTGAAGTAGANETEPLGGDTTGETGKQGIFAGTVRATFTAGTIDGFGTETALVSALSKGGAGGGGGEGNSPISGTGRGGDGNSGGIGNEALMFVDSGSFDTEATLGHVFLVRSLGGDGGDSGKGNASAGSAFGGAGGQGAVSQTTFLSLDDVTASASGGNAGAIASLQAFGGDGGDGGLASGGGISTGGDGGIGGSVEVGSSGSNALEVSIFGGTFEQTGIGSILLAETAGGAGGDGGKGDSGFDDSFGGKGGDGGSGGTIGVTLNGGTFEVGDDGLSAIFVQGLGGDGGDGGEAESDVNNDAKGGKGGEGGDGAAITVNSQLNTSTIKTFSTSKAQHGVRVESLAGSGGDGGDGKAPVLGDSFGGDGGAGGSGGDVNVELQAKVSTAGTKAQGVLVRSYGGAGGNGGNAEAAVGEGKGGAGAGSGPGGDAGLTFQGSITTTGDEANAAFVQSVGGFSGDAGKAQGLVAFGAGSQSAGDGGDVGVSLMRDTVLATEGASATAVLAQSVGGGGGLGSEGDGVVALGGDGSAGGDGGEVTISTAQAVTVTTTGQGARALNASSTGGGGGDGGSADGIVSLGGKGGSGGDGGSVMIDNLANLTTKGNQAAAIRGASVGGGGGSAHSTGGLVAIGGSGGDGGSGGSVTASSFGDIETTGEDSDGIFLHSVGGGGGAGSNALSVSAGLSVAIGGTGGDGGAGGSVTYDDKGEGDYSIATGGERSHGLLVESVGGGGGNGGNAISASASPLLDISVGASGDGGKGGDGGKVSVTSNGTISTEGGNAPAMHALSTGGGGGNAGTTVAADAAQVGLSVAIGGSGGGGGGGGAIDVTGSSNLSTKGDNSAGVLAHSTGGGGGHSGTTVAGTLVSRFSLNLSAGGDGGEGGDGGAVSVGGGGKIVTEGKVSPGVYAHSVGGGGGYAATTVAASGGSQGSVTASLGGHGGEGGKGGAVTVAVDKTIETKGNISPGVTALSIGGGGGHSGITLSGTAISTVAVDLSSGGDGGGGGDGGTVKVTSSQAITTGGHSSGAIVAHSTGGGGGATHFTGSFSGASEGSLNASSGGDGGVAGDGGEVTVDASGTLSTTGHNAPGISAFSIGGGGGDSGTTVSGALTSGEGNIGVTVGGDGGSSGSGSTVTVTSKADVTAKGKHSVGIHAKSIARGGGNAGTVVTATGLSTGNLGVTVGGGAGDGGTSGKVTVTNSGDVTTDGGFAPAISAQSIGGGGGSAKGSVTASAFSTKGSLNVTVGGDGGKGGTSGEVMVEGSGKLQTDGHHAHGILAQSHGGAGGEGGFAAEGSFTAGDVTGEVGISVGGSGGDGGVGGDVTVTAKDAISTKDFRATAIIAQSIGGNGGTGGNVYTGNLSFGTGKSAKVDVDIGGSGGAGGKAGAVTVTLAEGMGISTDGFLAQGVLAQSIGGNGGSGGNTYAVIGGLSGKGTASVNVNVGGGGGDGAKGSSVSLTSGAVITTSKGGSNGLHGQSVGGNGGVGGTAANLNLNLSKQAPAGDSFNANFGYTVGGSGGSGNGGGSVEVINEGEVTTLGDGSKGLVAHSVGGGGGDGGTASSMSVSVSDVCKLIARSGKFDCGGSDEEEGTAVQVSLSAIVGGDGAGGGDGGAVTATNRALLETSGKGAHGLVAHSHGGGGGTGGEGDIGLGAWTTNDAVNDIDKVFDAVTGIPSFTSISVAVGGSGGAAGDGGEVTATNSFVITTKGNHAYGIHAQSVGGGGGNGGGGSSGLWAVATVGGRGSGGGDGGGVTIDHSGLIQTEGEDAVGIFAQSVGGGGGTAGDVGKGFASDWDNLNIGVGVGIQEDAGDGGDGGDITASITGRIQTSGERAHGLVMQSVGGSGGVLGISGLLAGANINNFSGSVGDDGNGGTITATVSETIEVSGERAHGIFAQSVSGAKDGNDSGKITLDIQADVMATGKGGRAILAQSEGFTESGTIDITIAEGATVMTSANGAQTIGIRNGNENTILIEEGGSLLQEGGVKGSGHVIRTDGTAKLSVTNKGTLAGSVLTEASQTPVGPSAAATTPAPIRIDNFPGATFALGSEVTLGPEGELSNSGVMSAGGIGELAFSTVSGLVLQNPDGSTLVDIDFGRTNDLITITDSSGGFFQGSVTPNPLGGTPSSGDSGAFPFLRSDSDLKIGNLTVASTATVDYSLALATNNQGQAEALLGFRVDYSPWDGDAVAQAKVSDAARSRLHVNHDSAAAHIDDLVVSHDSGSLTASGEAFVEDLTLFLLTMEDVETLVDTYDRFAPGEIFAPTDAALFSSLRFTDSLMSCPEHGEDGAVTFTRQGSCLWLRSNGGGINRQRTGNSIEYDETLFGFSGGGQSALGDGFFAGLAFSYENSNLSNERFSGDGSRFQGGVVIKKEVGQTTLSGSFSGGVGNYDLSRGIRTPDGFVTADSSPDTNWIAVHGRAAHVVDLNEVLYLKPWFDVGVTRQWQGSFQESGAGDFGLDVAGFNTTMVTLNPMLELGGSFELFGAQANAKASAGMLALVAGRDRSTDVSFLGVGAGGPTFLVSDQARPVFADLGASLDVAIHDRAVISLSAGSLLSGNQQEYGGAGRISIFF